MIWKVNPSIDGLNAMCENTIASHIGIEFIEIGEDFLIASMPVDMRTHQPMGILHGGASVVLAETLGSVASYLCIDDYTKLSAVGLNVSADHLRPVSNGLVYGKVTPIKIGRKIHLWQIEIRNKNQQIVCSSKLSVMIIPYGKES